MLVVVHANIGGCTQDSDTPGSMMRMEYHICCWHALDKLCIPCVFLVLFYSLRTLSINSCALFAVALHEHIKQFILFLV